MSVCCVQKQNGDCHRRSHTLQLGSLSTSHICRAKLAEGKENKRGEGKQWCREKSLRKKTEAKKEVGTCVGISVRVRACVCVLEQCLTACASLLELIPVRSLQRAAVCHSLTPPLICWHPVSWSSRRRAAETFTLGCMAECENWLQLDLEKVWRV